MLCLGPHFKLLASKPRLYLQLQSLYQIGMCPFHYGVTVQSQCGVRRSSGPQAWQNYVGTAPQKEIFRNLPVQRLTLGLASEPLGV